MICPLNTVSIAGKRKTRVTGFAPIATHLTDMDFTTLGNLVEKHTLGVVSFIVLIVGGWRIFAWVGKFADKLLNNHLAHFQKSLETLITLVEGHGGKLDKIVEQTKKK